MVTSIKTTVSPTNSVLSESSIETKISDDGKHLTAIITRVISKAEYEELLKVASEQTTSKYLSNYDIVTSGSATIIESSLIETMNEDDDINYVISTSLDCLTDDAAGILPSSIGTAYSVYTIYP